MSYAFGATDILATLGVTAADFEIQESNPGSNEKDIATVMSKLGAYVSGGTAQYNERDSYGVTLKAKKESSVTSPTIALGGAGTDDLVLVRFSLRQVFNDFAVIKVDGHKHTGDATHTTSPASVSVPSMTIGFGVLDKVCLDALQDDIQSIEWTIEGQHVDKLTRLGVFMVGATHGFKQTCQVELVDNGASPTLATGWLRDAADVITRNTDFGTRTIRASKYTI
jgi:hypothetical protein